MSAAIGTKAQVVYTLAPDAYEDVLMRRSVERRNELALRIFVNRWRPDVSERKLDRGIRWHWERLESALPSDAEGWSPPIWLLRTWVELPLL